MARHAELQTVDARQTVFLQGVRRLYWQIFSLVCASSLVQLCIIFAPNLHLLVYSPNTSHCDPFSNTNSRWCWRRFLLCPATICCGWDRPQSDQGAEFIRDFCQLKQHDHQRNCCPHNQILGDKTPLGELVMQCKCKRSASVRVSFRFILQYLICTYLILVDLLNIAQIIRSPIFNEWVNEWTMYGSLYERMPDATRIKLSRPVQSNHLRD